MRTGRSTNAVMGLLCAALLSGCVSSGTREADRYFLLEATPRAGAAARPSVAVQVAPTSVESFYDTQSIVFSRAPGTRAYYQFNHWTERPHGAIHKALASRLEAGGQGSGLVLRTHLEEIYHDASAQPGTAHIKVNAQLIDPSRRAVLARRTFSQAAPAASYDAPGAVQGFRHALAALLDEVAAWVEAEGSVKR
jgi:cholesterol transport system auxiliary component